MTGPRALPFRLAAGWASSAIGFSMNNSVVRTWIINGEERTVECAPLRRLLDVLREDLGLKGAKEGCGEGECGSCTVVIDGDVKLACLTAAGQVVDGARITSVEGLEKTRGGRLLQEAYARKGAAQCGFCIPGMLASSFALLSRRRNPDDRAIRDAHAGNICRCTGYERIVEAVRYAAMHWPAEGEE